MHTLLVPSQTILDDGLAPSFGGNFVLPADEFEIDEPLCSWTTILTQL